MKKIWSLFALACLFGIGLFLNSLLVEKPAQAATARRARTKLISITSGADRFAPFGVTIHAGDSIKWVNNDLDQHIIVSDDFFNSVKEKNIYHPLIGTVEAANNGQLPSTYKLKFTKPGLFIYYCSIHASLDSQHQPVSNMHDGSPAMMGVISVR